MPSEHMPLHISDHINLTDQIPAMRSAMVSGTQERTRNKPKPPKLNWHAEPLPTQIPNDHEYHEISDEENLVAESPRFEVNNTGTQQRLLATNKNDYFDKISSF